MLGKSVREMGSLFDILGGMGKAGNKMDAAAIRSLGKRRAMYGAGGLGALGALGRNTSSATSGLIPKSSAPPPGQMPGY